MESIKPGPKEANVRGYKPMRGQPEPGGVITISGWFENDDLPKPGEYQQDWQARLRQAFGDDAQKVYEVLAGNLPGGTLDQLLIKFLERKLSLYVVQDIPDTTIKDIAERARAFVWEPEQWEAYTDSKGSNSVAWPPEWLLLCQAVEKRYGPPPVEDH